LQNCHCFSPASQLTVSSTFDAGQSSSGCVQSSNANGIVTITCPPVSFSVASYAGSIKLPLTTLLASLPQNPQLAVAEATISNILNQEQPGGLAFQFTNVNSFLTFQDGLDGIVTTPDGLLPFAGGCPANTTCRFGVDGVFRSGDSADPAFFLNVGQATDPTVTLAQNTTGNGTNPLNNPVNVLSFTVSFALQFYSLSSPVFTPAIIRGVDSVAPAGFNESIAPPFRPPNPFVPVAIPNYPPPPTPKPVKSRPVSVATSFGVYSSLLVLLLVVFVLLL